MPALHASEPTAIAPAKRRRWWRMALVFGLLLLAYAGTLAWAAQRLERDVLKNLHPAPAVMRADNASD